MLQCLYKKYRTGGAEKQSDDGWREARKLWRIQEFVAEWLVGAAIGMAIAHWLGLV